jgi:hypothetical protein
MGYHAPSAEEVYRYALRLDDSKRSLTDRFGLSIVLVNDTSPVCREFLDKYCLDLCLRTADRIRFIFFSEIPDDEFQRFTNDLNKGRGRVSGGMLVNIISLISQAGLTKKRFDTEEDPWRQLRPEALLPLKNADDIQKHLGWECDVKTAMPGAGMAMQFAQRLGIGRYVPCMLFFTDIGKKRVDLLPMKNLSPEEIYYRLRNWIDRFYEVNRHGFGEWSTVEKELEQYCQQAGQSLADIRNYKESSQKIGRTLTDISTVIYKIETENDLFGWQNATGSFARKYSIPNELRDQILIFESLVNRKRKAPLVPFLQAAIDSLSRMEEAGPSLKYLKNLKQELKKEIEYQIPPYLDLAIQELDKHLGVDPIFELREWWRSCKRHTISVHVFKRQRYSWIHDTGYKFFDARAEYDFLLDKIGKFPLVNDPGTSTRKILDELAAFYGLNPDSEVWQKDVFEFRTYLHDFFSRIQEDAPSWLLDAKPRLMIEVTVQLHGNVMGGSFDEFLAKSPLLKQALEKANNSTSPIPNTVRNNIEAVINHLRGLIDLFSITEADLRANREDLLLMFRQWHSKLEAELNHLLKESVTKGKARPPSYQQAKKLLELLENYDRVIDTIEYPFQNDPSLLTVPLEVPIVYATGLEGKEHERTSGQIWREKLTDAIKSEETRESLKPVLYQETSGFTPAGKLAVAIKEVVEETRLAAIFAPFQGKNLDEKVELAITNQQIEPIITMLSQAEQGLFLYNLRADGQLSSDSVQTSPKLAVEILVQAGVYKGILPKENPTSDESALSLSEKITRNQFDAFVAYNTPDRLEVIKLCKYLQQRGVYPWVDIDQIPPGRWYQDVIQSIIPNVGSALIIIGKQGIGRWQILELRSFISESVTRNIPVIPVLLPGVNDMPEDLKFLHELSCVQFHQQIEEEEPLDRLIWGITGRRKTQVRMQ